jgi:hypothetical protein
MILTRQRVNTPRPQTAAAAPLTVLMNVLRFCRAILTWIVRSGAFRIPTC